MNCILATNNKNIEKHISSIPSLTVLTQLKRREQVIDAVINRNPNCLILASSLPGKMTFREIIETLRSVSPKTKIIFLYGDPDGEQKAFCDFLVRQGVYDFIIGHVDEMNLSDAILKNAAFEDVASFLLTDLPEPEPSAVVEKIVKEYIGNITVGIGSLFPRSGCTHISLEIITYLTNAGYDVGLVISEPVYAALNKYYEMQDNKIDGCSLYTDVATALNAHKSVIIDFGVLDEGNIDEYNKCSVKLILSPSAVWEIDTLTDFIKNYPFAKKVKYLFYPISETEFKDYKANLAQGECSAYRICHNEDCFIENVHNTKIYKEILKDMLPARKSKKSKN